MSNPMRAHVGRDCIDERGLRCDGGAEGLRVWGRRA
jgi:hypothetical protein